MRSPYDAAGAPEHPADREPRECASCRALRREIERLRAPQTAAPPSQETGGDTATFDHVRRAILATTGEGRDPSIATLAALDAFDSYAALRSPAPVARWQDSEARKTLAGYFRACGNGEVPEGTDCAVTGYDELADWFFDHILAALRAPQTPHPDTVMPKRKPTSDDCPICRKADAARQEDANA